MYRIRWTAIKTGATGAGTGHFPYREAARYRDQLNADPKSKPFLTFTIEPAPKETTHDNPTSD